ncbi:hypothetical protein ACTWPB_04575 [Nocardia sp. IBHARD005]|uniref:hypothetical protein n=1 Tax=Nocardia sp. IBHARD005 TaxID=3457765 RepID=UPI0040587300
MTESPTWANIPTDGSADEILDIGANGLQYFVQYLPRYEKAVVVTKTTGARRELMGADLNTLIYSKFDAERGMDIGAIDRMSAALSKVMAKVPGEIDEQRRQLSALPSIWQGQAGDSASNMLNTQIIRAEQDRIEAATISLELNYVSTALRTAVRHKAVTVQSFWSPNTPDIPQQNSSGMSRTAIDDLIGEVIRDAESDEGKKAKQWLVDIFVPHVHATYDKFIQLCKEVDTEVRRVYGVLVEALNGLDTAVYPMPQDSSKQQTPVTTQQPQTKDTSTGGTPSTTEDTSTKPATTEDPSTTKDDDDDDDDDITDTISEITDTVSEVITGLTSLVSSVSELESLVTTTAETISSGLTSLSTSIQEGFASISSQLTGLMSGGATFDLNGTQVSVGTDANGQLTVSTTDSAGNSHEYGMTLDANGIPVISDDQSSGEIGSGTPETGTGQGPTGLGDTDDEGTSSGATPNPTGSLNAKGYAAENMPGAGSTPSADNEPDGEHWAEQYPVSPQPDPGDTGAVLAEAGPL